MVQMVPLLVERPDEQAEKLGGQVGMQSEKVGEVLGELQEVEDERGKLFLQVVGEEEEEE